MQLVQLERITELGRRGEILAAERMKVHGFGEEAPLQEHEA